MLRQLFKPAWAVVLIIIILLLQAFTSKAGGEVFEIYLNNKLILQQAVYKPFTLQSLQLDKSNINDELVIYYHHCGQPGKGRSIAIKDEKGTIIREWKFADGDGRAGMRIPVKELLQLDKNYAHANLSIFYMSQQLPKGRALSALQLNGRSTTWNSERDYWPAWAVRFS
ncbi:MULTISPECIES: hypothetical protein [Niastella]|uniref:Uncharacterized protein n=1 Tax=Niastella soli TaxID=2821487 RepID=A0ABS3YPV8_9BACT|nr:hypothetical protein [Niastella soli]MBO9199924.1 hypothetical protein [Niastella soli]